MSSPTAFEQAVASGDLEALVGALAPDVVFRSPVVFKPYEGREAVGKILEAVTRVFDGFEYAHRFEADGRRALIFTARVGDREVEGLDLLQLDDQGRVRELTVMVRPMSGMHALAAAMRDELVRMGVVSPDEEG